MTVLKREFMNVSLTPELERFLNDSPKRPILFQRGSVGNRRAAQGDGRGEGRLETLLQEAKTASGDRMTAQIGGHRKRRLKEAPVRQVRLIPWLA